MIGFLYFLLVLLAILALARLLPLLFLIGGTAWLWHSAPWVLVGALLLGAAVGIWKSLHNQDEPAIHRPSSTGLPSRHGIRRRFRRGLFC
jgi:hypothetical protein